MHDIVFSFDSNSFDLHIPQLMYTRLPGELILAPHPPSPGWHAVLVITVVVMFTGHLQLVYAWVCLCRMP